MKSILGSDTDVDYNYYPFAHPEIDPLDGICPHRARITIHVPPSAVSIHRICLEQLLLRVDQCSSLVL